MFYIVVSSDLHDTHPLFWSQSLESIDRYLARLTREEAQRPCLGSLYYVELWGLSNNGHCDSEVVACADDEKWCCRREATGGKKRTRKNSEQKDLF